MTDPIRIAVVGSGRLGTFHGQKIRKLENSLNLEFVGIVDPSERQRVQACTSLQCRGFADLYDGLLDNLDAVVVAAPTLLHYNIGSKLLRRGIHTLMEKPVTVTLPQADALLSLAHENNAVFQVGHVERFNPAFTEARNHIELPRYIHSQRTSAFTFRSIDVGVTLDLLIHDIDLALSMVNSPVKRVDAIGKALVSGHEDVVQARLTFENGCIADLEASRVSRSPMRKMEVWTKDCFTEIDFASRTVSCIHPDEQILCGDFNVNELSEDDFDYFKEHLMDEMLPQTTQSFAAVDALELEMRDFISSINNRRSPLVSGKAGRDAVAVAQRILDSIESNQRTLLHFAPMPTIFRMEDYKKVG